LATTLPNWFLTRYWSGTKDIQSLLGSVQSYKTSIEQTLKGYGRTQEDRTTSDMQEDNDEDSEEDNDESTEPKEGEHMEGDIVEGYVFKGGDPGKEANYRKATPEELAKSKK